MSRPVVYLAEYRLRRAWGAAAQAWIVYQWRLWHLWWEWWSAGR